MKEILKQDMDGMFARWDHACKCALCVCEGKLSGVVEHFGILY